jgi:hypothetical protein
MAGDESPRTTPPPIWLRPWTLVGVALGLAVVALILAGVELGRVFWLRPTLFGLSALLAGVAVWRRFADGLPEDNERMEAAGLMLTAALAALLGGLACGDGDRVTGVVVGGKLEETKEQTVAGTFVRYNPKESLVTLRDGVLGHHIKMADDFPVTVQEGETKRESTVAGVFSSLEPETPVAVRFGEAFDSGFMVGVALFLFGLFGAVLVALPSPLRKAAASAAILFHFGGILTAVTSIEPAGRDAPWLSVKAWAHVYRPYLGFFYLNNAYHFYSPEPGPPTLLWYRVEYESGHTQWFRLPDRSHDPNPMHYQRILAVTESMNQVRTLGPGDQVAWDIVDRNRRAAAETFGIPMHPDPRVTQFAEPQEYSKITTATYARHLARTTVRADKPEDRVVRIRMYRVIHDCLLPNQLAQGVDPKAPYLYRPYYHGEFDVEGNLLSRPDDPFLYWLIPIFQDPRNPKVVFDGLKMHDQVPSYKDIKNPDAGLKP